MTASPRSEIATTSSSGNVWSSSIRSTAVQSPPGARNAAYTSSDVAPTSTPAPAGVRSAAGQEPSGEGNVTRSATDSPSRLAAMNRTLRREVVRSSPGAPVGREHSALVTGTVIGCVSANDAAEARTAGRASQCTEGALSRAQSARSASAQPKKMSPAPAKASATRIARTPSERRAAAVPGGEQRDPAEAADADAGDQEHRPPAAPTPDAAANTAAQDAIVSGFEAVAAAEVANARRGEATSYSVSAPSRTRKASRSVLTPRNSRTAAPSSDSVVRSGSIASSDAAPAAPRPRRGRPRRRSRRRSRGRPPSRCAASSG